MKFEHTLNFGRPIFLWGLLILIPLALVFWRAHRQREQLLAKIVALRLRASLLSSVSPWRRVARSLLVLFAWGFLVIALAEPRWGYEERKMISRGRDVMLAIDTSRSMLATDVTPTRLARAELLGQDVLDLLPGDRVGVIAFSGNAFLQAPMTLDHSALTASLAELDTTLIPKGGTNISEAIRTAETAFGKGEGTSRALIIITDGEDLEEDAVETAKQAAGQGIKIFTIGIGSTGGSLIPIKNENGGSDFVRDERGKPVLSKLDEVRLKEIAEVTGGFYEAFSPQAARMIVEKGIMPLEAGMTGEMSAKRPIERYEIPASIALFFLILSLLLKDVKSFLPHFWRRKFFMACGIILVLISASGAEATPGIQEYEQGNYEAALQRFEQRLEKIPSSPEVRFDAGAAAYKKGDYQKAERYFTDAMTSSDLKLQEAATYNLANTLVRSGEKQQDRSLKLSDWKNALQHYDTVLKQDPNNKNAKENRDLVKKMIEDLQKKQEKKNSSQDKNQQQDQQQQDKNQQHQNQSKSQDQQQQNQSQSQDQQQQNQNQSQDQQQQNQNQSQDQQQQNQSQSQDQQQKQNQQRENSASQQQGSSPSSQQQQNQPQNQEQPQQGSDSSTPTPAPSPNDPKSQQNSSGQGEQKENPTPTPSMPQQGEDQRSSPQQQQQQSSVTSPMTPSPTPGNKKSGTLQEAGKHEEQSPVLLEEEKEGKGMSRHQAESILRSVQDEEQQVKFQQRRNSEEVTKDW